MLEEPEAQKKAFITEKTHVNATNQEHNTIQTKQQNTRKEKHTYKTTDNTIPTLVVM